MEKKYLLVYDGPNRHALIGAFENVTDFKELKDETGEVYAITFNSDDGSFEYDKQVTGYFACEENDIKFTDYKLVGRRTLRKYTNNLSGVVHGELRNREYEPEEDGADGLDYTFIDDNNTGYTGEDFIDELLIDSPVKQVLEENNIAADVDEIADYYISCLEEANIGVSDEYKDMLKNKIANALFELDEGEEDLEESKCCESCNKVTEEVVENDDTPFMDGPEETVDEAIVNDKGEIQLTIDDYDENGELKNKVDIGALLKDLNDLYQKYIDEDPGQIEWGNGGAKLVPSTNKRMTYTRGADILMTLTNTRKSPFNKIKDDVEAIVSKYPDIKVNIIHEDSFNDYYGRRFNLARIYVYFNEPLSESLNESREKKYLEIYKNGKLVGAFEDVK